MKTRLKDIAEATGFSVNTVSHALRDEPDIAPETKRYIREVARQLDYIPNIPAGSIKSGRSRILSVILPDIGNPHFTIVFREIEAYFSKRGMTPFFMNTREDRDDEENAVRLSIAQNVDGVLICPTQADAECVRLLDRSRVPFVLFGRHFDDPVDADYVICDDTEGARLATAYLLGEGHRNICCVRYFERVSSDRERFEGYRRAFADAGVPLREDMTLPLTGSAEENREAIRRFLTGHPDCTAFLSFNDILAYMIIREALSLGLRVPEDLSVMGFDNICSDYPFPIPLSSVSVSKKHAAQIASELLYTRMTERTPDPVKKHIVLPTGLFLRDTTGPVRRSDPREVPSPEKSGA